MKYIRLPIWNKVHPDMSDAFREYNHFLGVGCIHIYQQSLEPVVLEPGGCLRSLSQELWKGPAKKTSAHM